MATQKPVLCLNCGAQVKKNGYCSACNMPVSVLKKAYNTSDYYYNIGYDKACARDLSGAIESLHTSLRYNKKNIMSRNLLGLIYYELGENVMAMSHWVMSSNYQTSGNLATKYLKEINENKDKLEEADMLAKKFNTALDYAYSGDYDLSIIQLRSALSDNPHFVKGYLLLALINIKVNNYERARTIIRKVLSIDRANPIAIHYLREMGDSDATIIRIRNEMMNPDKSTSEELDDIAADILEDEDILKNPRVKKKTQSRRATANVKSSIKEVNFVKYSGMYVVLGMVLGILLLYYVMIPAQRKKSDNKNEDIIKSYSEELVTKNTNIKALNDRIELLEQTISEMEQKQLDEDNKQLPDYSNISSGLSDSDIQNMLKDE